VQLHSLFASTYVVKTNQVNDVDGTCRTRAEMRGSRKCLIPKPEGYTATVYSTIHDDLNADNLIMMKLKCLCIKFFPVFGRVLFVVSFSDIASFSFW